VADRLFTNDRLYPQNRRLGTDRITSNNRQFQVLMQNDGNLVLYRNRDGRPLWASRTDGIAVDFCIMQSDGNLVLYGFNRNAVWASGTDGRPGSIAIIQDDANFVIYQPSQAVWASGTNSQT
jgi:hypothetical protein